MNTNKSVLKLPRELADLQKMQGQHHAATTQNMMIQWRDFLIGEIQDKLRKTNNFFEGDNDVYEASQLKRIITRYEYILNTYLREFVSLSIRDWVEFVKLFTMPASSDENLWRVNDEPLVIIHLSIKKKDKKKKDKKKAEKKEKEEIEEEEEEEDDKNRVTYKPSVEECHKFVLSSLDMVIKSINSVNNLEADLMPFLSKTSAPNFEINHEFPWIKDAAANLDAMVSGNTAGTTELLERYKKYEYILNVDKKELIHNLFGDGTEANPKKSMEEIKEQILHYEQAHYEIMTLSEDEVDFRIFRVIAKNLKEELGDQANKIKEKILDQTYKYCTDTVTDVFKTYSDMKSKIMHEPADEKELIQTKEHIAEAPAKVEELTETLKEVYTHYLMLEEFSYMYKE